LSARIIPFNIVLQISAIQELLYAQKHDGIKEKHIYAIAGPDTPLANLFDGGPDDDDFLPAFERGSESERQRVGNLLGETMPKEATLQNSRRHHVSSSRRMPLELFETHVDTLADRIEALYEQVDQQNAMLSKPDAVLDEAIVNLGVAESLNEKLRFCLMDQQQTLANLNRRRILDGSDSERLVTLLADIQSLIDHAEGILQRISLHASMVLSRTQLADSRITKVFSVVATLFLPPTMIASIYGMNFQSMPEFSWPHGYALAVALMAFSSVAPFLYFKYRRWL
jgi:magnesium/cobalt transport protein CorA